jgi:hypothetical protein
VALPDVVDTCVSNQQELIEQLGVSFNALADREEDQERRRQQAQGAGVEVVAYFCKECDRHTEAFNVVCKQKGHDIRKVKTKRRAYVCADCSKPLYTVGPRPPDRPCPRYRADDRGVWTPVYQLWSLVGSLTSVSLLCSSCGAKVWRKPVAGASDKQGPANPGLPAFVPAIGEWNRFDDIAHLYT